MRLSLAPKLAFLSSKIEKVSEEGAQPPPPWEIEKFSGEGAQPPHPWGGGHPLPTPNLLGAFVGTVVFHQGNACGPQGGMKL